MLALAELCRRLAVANPSERTSGHALIIGCDIAWDRTKTPPDPITRPKVWSATLTTPRVVGAAVYYSTNDPTPYDADDLAAAGKQRVHSLVDDGPRYHDDSLEALRAVLDDVVDRMRREREPKVQP